jgi:hypothetical protein
MSLTSNQGILTSCGLCHGGHKKTGPDNYRFACSPGQYCCTCSACGLPFVQTQEGSVPRRREHSQPVVSIVLPRGPGYLTYNCAATVVIVGFLAFPETIRMSRRGLACKPHEKDEAIVRIIRQYAYPLLPPSPTWTSGTSRVRNRCSERFILLPNSSIDISDLRH